MREMREILRPTRLAFWVAFFVAFGGVLRFQGLDWDNGHGFHPDEGNLVRAALSLGWPDRLIPAFHAYNDLALWLPKLAAFPFCQGDDATCLRLTARALSALFSTLQIWVGAEIAYRLARPSMGKYAAVMAAGLLALSAPLVQWAHFGTTESALALLVLVMWLIAIRFVGGQLSIMRAAVLSGVVLGVGFGLKSAAMAVAVIPIAALILGPHGRLRQWAPALAAGVMLSLLIGGLTTPSLIFAYQDWLDVMRFERGVVQGSNDVFWTRQFVGAQNVFFELRQIWGMVEGIGVLLAIAGLVVLMREGRARAAPGVLFALIYAAIIFTWYAKFARYLAPLIPVILILAAIGGAHVMRMMKVRTLQSAVICGLGLFAVTGFDRALSYQSSDPRIQADKAIAKWTGADDLIALEPHDIALTGGRQSIFLPLDPADGGASVAELTTALAETDWYLIASRRNWSVLPSALATKDIACGFYAALAQGELGFYPARNFRRHSPFGALLSPGLGAEETRSVFDRPWVILMENRGRLDAQTMQQRIDVASRIGACAAVDIANGLARQW